MKPADRDAEMARFRDGELDVLVGTTVIEVGVDVPEATMMIIEGADRFGLAQLHQLRGRVGRGTAESFCVLVSDSTDETAQARLKAVAEIRDGFELAENGLRAPPRGRRPRASPRAACRGCGSPRSRAATTATLAVRPATTPRRCSTRPGRLGRDGLAPLRRELRARLAGARRGRGPGERLATSGA